MPGKESPRATGGEAAPALRPGELPAGATAEARAAWETVGKASLGTAGDRAPVDRFELALDVRYRGGSRGTNDLQAEYRFLAPGYVRVRTVESRKIVGRGPEGDWLYDEPRDERVRIGAGREYAEDRRQLEEWAGIARNFIALTDPRSLRIAGLEILPRAPAVLPEALAKRGSELAWLAVRSPDFRLVGAPPGTAQFRASLGYDRRSGAVELALVEEDVRDPRLLPDAKLVQLGDPRPAGGVLVPYRILVYSIEEGRAPAAFTAVPGMDLVVKSANLRPAFGPEAFRSP
jgi:hypothetical protein